VINAREAKVLAERAKTNTSVQTVYVISEEIARRAKNGLFKYTVATSALNAGTDVSIVMTKLQEMGYEVLLSGTNLHISWLNVRL